MRGFPLLQLAIVLVFFAVAAAPVWSLTHLAQAARTVPASAAPPATRTTVAAGDNAAPAVATQPVSVDVSFAPAPADFQVRCGELTVLAGHGPERQFSTVWPAVLPKEGLDLVVRAHWPAEADAAAGAATGPAAMRVRIRRPGGAGVDKSFWTAPGEDVAEVITLPGATASPASAPTP